MEAFDEVRVERSARRTRSVSAHREGSVLVVRIPAHFSRRQESEWVERMRERLLAKEGRRTRRTDGDLAERAAELARTVLEPRVGRPVVPRSIRWVENQNTRWGSCSVETSEIRLSHRLKGMPAWVVDQVILHELAHLVEPSHGPRFKQLIDHPDLARADAYLEGWLAGRSTAH